MKKVNLHSERVNQSKTSKNIFIFLYVSDPNAERLDKNLIFIVFRIIYE